MLWNLCLECFGFLLEFVAILLIIESLPGMFWNYVECFGFFLILCWNDLEC